MMGTGDAKLLTVRALTWGLGTFQLPGGEAGQQSHGGRARSLSGSASSGALLLPLVACVPRIPP